MILTTIAALQKNPLPTRDEIRVAIRGNLCRCTGYQKIVDAVERVFGKEAVMRPVFLPTEMDELRGLLSQHPEGALYAGARMKHEEDGDQVISSAS